MLCIVLGFESFPFPIDMPFKPYNFNIGYYGILLTSTLEILFQITGSANGIGREICVQLAPSRATLVCWDINQRDNELLVQELRRSGTRAYGFTIDISDRTAVESVGLRVCNIHILKLVRDFFFHTNQFPTNPANLTSRYNERLARFR